MTTQFERDQMRHEREDRRLHALVQAATDALPAIQDPMIAGDLRDALKPFNLDYLRQAVDRASEEDARRRRVADNLARATRLFDESPDAPPRMQCEAFVTRQMGRWTDFGRCENEAKRVIRDDRRERVVCTPHAKNFLRDGNLGIISWWDSLSGDHSKYATHMSWYRSKRWCMVPVDGKFCKVKTIDIGTEKHEGSHKPGKEPYEQRQGVVLGPIAQR